MPPFKYRARKTEDVDKRATQKGNDYAGALVDGVKAYKKRDGENWIRILPPTWTIENFPEFCNEEGPNHYGIDVWLHEYFGPGNSTAICNLKMAFEKSCALCIARMQAEDSGDEEEAKQLKPRKKVLIALVDMKDEAAGDQFWLMPWGLDRDIAVISKDRRTGEIYLIDDPDYGYGVFFDVTGKDIATKYVGASLERKPSAITDAQLNYIIEHPLPTVLQKRTNAELQALYRGELVDDDRPRRGERSREREPEPIDRGRSRERDPEPEPERERERPTQRSANTAESSSNRRTRDVQNVENGPTSRSERGSEEARPIRAESQPARGVEGESRTESASASETTRSHSRRREEPAEERQESRPTTRSRTTAAADTPSDSASARTRPRVAESESNGGSPAKSRAEQLRERFGKSK
jgi:hypothetical protein